MELGVMRDGQPVEDPPLAAQGRFGGRDPIAIVDIGSNSVRLVVYEGVTRSPWVLFNEKVMCGLGRGLATTGRLPEDGVELALATLERFRALADQSRVRVLHVIATAAARDAANGPDFVREAERILRTPIRLLSGEEEARFAALAVVSGIHGSDGIVGDLGGGSLELTDVRERGVFRPGVSLRLGGLRLHEEAEGSTDKARKIARKALEDVPALREGKGRTFYAVGGTWRALARLQMAHRDYPMHLMQEYELVDAADYCAIIADTDPDDVPDLDGAAEVSKARRPLLPIGAAVLAEIVRQMEPSRVVISGAGVREGFLYAQLSGEEQRADPLIAAASDLATLNSRDPQHGRELAGWTERSLAALGVEETEAEHRARVAACLLTDIAWRASPDYRAMQALRTITFGAYLGADHQMRLMMGLAIFFRYAGLKAGRELPDFAAAASEHTLERGRLLGALFRVAYLFSGAQRGIVPKLGWRQDGNSLVVTVPSDRSDLLGEKPDGRLTQLSKLLDRPLRYAVG